MKTMTRMGLTAAAASAVTVVGLAIAALYDDYKSAALDVIKNRTECEDWCPCKCNQSGCGCHE